ncbi:MAG: hypothetical protein GY809_26710 [Planctomycetes bacterium]|nr:hypothetical protein [Planctomycetota bacterium]
MMSHHQTRILLFVSALCTAMLVLPALSGDVSAPDTAKPLKVYILAGQSNMQGSAHKTTFAAMGDDPKTAGLLKEILDENGDPVESDNAWVTYLTGNRDGDVTLQGTVKVGYGFDSERIGPEYGFGLFMDKALDEPVLIIKTAWGGKSLAVDFRPPSAGPYVPSATETERGNVPEEDRVGHYYREMLRFVRSTLEDTESIRQIVPGYDASQGYELAGFVWFQGWNDMCNRHHIAQYTDNMIHFITDVRKAFDAPTLPFIVGILGVYGTDPDSRRFDKGLPVTAFRATQFAAVAQYDQKASPPYRGHVIAVDSGPYYDLTLSDIYWKRRMTGEWTRRVAQGKMNAEQFKAECTQYGFGDGELTAQEQRTWDECASNAEYHYLGSAKTFVRFGQALAEAMLAMEDAREDPPKKTHFDPVVKDIEGWTVDVDPQMLKGEHAEAGARALTMLANHLQRIAILMPQDRLQEMRTLGIWIEHDHPDINVEPGPYHPGVVWLTERGYDPRLAKKVHVTRGASLLERHHMLKHPAVILHELAHAYHHQILGFDEPRIKAAYDKAMTAGLYDKVLLYTGQKARHYAATNHMEYFAEGTEAYFYKNDFYPFVRAQLAQYDPALHDLLEAIWGPVK